VETAAPAVWRRTQVMEQLAIIIPAYRARFLAEALDSVLAQTDQRFNLYVFDDASPDALPAVIQPFQARRPLTYHRFAENLGGRSLSQHWDRCLQRTTEPWIWLFSDDDVMEPTCVESFWREIEITRGAFDLYRFNTRCINARSELVSTNDPYPQEEWGRDFLLVRLRERRGSTAQELLFSREAWKGIGGFPDYPLAWAADDAFIARLGEKKPIRLISGPRIQWRLSGTNITSADSTPVFSRKILASRMFIAWAREFLAKEKLGPQGFGRKELDAMTEAWFFRWLFFMRTRLSWQICSEVDRFATEVWQYPRGYGWLRCLLWNGRMIAAAARRRLRARLGRKRPRPQEQSVRNHDPDIHGGDART
jgi:glycosyltransferase involved in cell wall biosynthesis